MPTEPLTVAVITGGHSYDVINFHKFFQSLHGVEAYIQHLDDFATAKQRVRDSYDVLLFYIMMMDGPTDEGLPGFRGKPRKALERLGATEQGIVVLHHGLLAYPQWSVWHELVGIPDRTLAGYEHDQTLRVQIADPHHPITQGLSDWTMVDETYDMADAAADAAADALANNHILLTVDQPHSMHTVAWTRHYQRSRVFCLQSGHNNQTWVDPNFKAVLERGLAWSCGRL